MMGEIHITLVFAFIGSNLKARLVLREALVDDHSLVQYEIVKCT